MPLASSRVKTVNNIRKNKREKKRETRDISAAIYRQVKRGRKRKVSDTQTLVLRYWKKREHVGILVFIYNWGKNLTALFVYLNFNAALAVILTENVCLRFV